MAKARLLTIVTCAALSACDGPRKEPAAGIPRDVDFVTHALGPRRSVRATLQEFGGRPEAALVFLHGVGGSNDTWEALGGPDVLSDALGTDQPSLRLLTVAIAGDTLGWSDHRDGSVSWEIFLRDELKSQLRSMVGEHLTARHIAYLGTSAGGEKVITMSLRHPSAFSCVAAHSPAVHPADPVQLPDWARNWEGWGPIYGLPIDPSVWQANNALHLAATTDAEKLADLNLYFDVGVDDHLGFQGTSGELSATLSKRGIPHDFALRRGGHGNEFTAANLAHSIRFLVGCLTDNLEADPVAF